jgi:hypothetical protein
MLDAVSLHTGLLFPIPCSGQNPKLIRVDDAKVI